MDPLTAQELALLNGYTDEVLRGIMHTDNWNHYMAGLQTRLNAMIDELQKKEGTIAFRQTGFKIIQGGTK